ncbi:DUF4129 domain-containing protein [Nocardiopsis oceani]
MRPLLAAPAEVTREEGRRRAIEELSDPLYGEHEPSLFDRFLAWLDELLGRLVSAGEGVVPGGWLLGVVLLVILVLVIVLIVYLRPSWNRRAGVPLHEGQVLSATDHRAAADRHEAEGAFAAAVTERLRAISVDLEERTIVSPRAGRTATELADEAATTLPGEAAGLHDGARIFNDVAYGDRVATAEAVRTLRELDVRLSAARPEFPEAGLSRPTAPGQTTSSEQEGRR